MSTAIVQSLGSGAGTEDENFWESPSSVALSGVLTSLGLQDLISEVEECGLELLI